MRVAGALVREQGQTFAIVLVKPPTLHQSDREDIRAEFSRSLGGVETILASQESAARFRYFGRHDIVRFLASIDPRRIPWGHFNIA